MQANCLNVNKRNGDRNINNILFSTAQLLETLYGPTIIFQGYLQFYGYY